MVFHSRLIDFKPPRLSNTPLSILTKIKNAAVLTSPFYVYFSEQQISVNSWLIFNPIGWGCRIHRLHLCIWCKPPPNDCPGYDTQLSADEALVLLELWVIWSTSSLPSLPDLLWPVMVAPDRVLSNGQIELFDV